MKAKRYNFKVRYYDYNILKMTKFYKNLTARQMNSIIIKDMEYYYYSSVESFIEKYNRFFECKLDLEKNEVYLIGERNDG